MIVKIFNAMYQNSFLSGNSCFFYQYLTGPVSICTNSSYCPTPPAKNDLEMLVRERVLNPLIE